jgi:hypothetical protein
MRVLANGNFGISTTTPYAQLSVGISSSTPALAIGALGSSTPSLYVGSANSNGYVGIGTAAPTVPLDVESGNVKIGGLTINPTNGGTTIGQTFAILVTTANALILTSGTGDPVIIKNFNGNSTLAFRDSGSNNDIFLRRFGAAMLQLGGANSATPIAQTLKVQDVLTGTSDTAGANFAITGSKGTGTGVGGSILFQTAPAGLTGTAQNATTTAMLITGNGLVGIGTTTPGSLLSVGGNTTGTNFFNDATTSKSGTGGYNIATGCYAVAGVCIGAGGTTYTGTYPITVTGTVISDAISTTTALTWSGLQTFSNTGTTTFAGGIQAGTLVGAPYFNATSTTATSTFAGGISVGALQGVVHAVAGKLLTALVDLSTEVTGVLAAINGGTGQSTYTTGDILYSSASNILSKLGIGSTGQVLTVAGGVPTWAAPSGNSITSYFATSTASSYVIVPVVAGDRLEIFGQGQRNSNCAGSARTTTLYVKPTTFAASTSPSVSGGQITGVGCTMGHSWYVLATTTDTYTIEVEATSVGIDMTQVLVNRIR